MRTIRYIFDFENCETFSVDPSYVDELTISGITKCLQFKHDEERTFLECRSLTLHLASDALLVWAGSGREVPNVTADRLLQGDLVAVDIIGDEGNRTIYVPWKDGSESGDSNKLQCSEKTAAGYQVNIGFNYGDGDV